MQALRDEMDLRDQTRETEKSRPPGGHPATDERPWRGLSAEDLARKQSAISASVRSAIDDIGMLDQPGQFQKESRLLNTVAEVMDEAASILARPDTGPDAIAAETEAIELLLQASRNTPGGGGGSGQGNGGGSAGDAALPGAALAALGPGAGPPRTPRRSVSQATGHTGRELPEEFRSGLDAYFHALEKRRTSR